MHVLPVVFIGGGGCTADVAAAVMVAVLLWVWRCGGPDNMMVRIILVVVVVCVKCKCGGNGDVVGTLDMVVMVVVDGDAGAICDDNEACTDWRFAFLS